MRQCARSEVGSGQLYKHNEGHMLYNEGMLTLSMKKVLIFELYKQFHNRIYLEKSRIKWQYNKMDIQKKHLNREDNSQHLFKLIHFTQ